MADVSLSLGGQAGINPVAVAIIKFLKGDISVRDMVHVAWPAAHVESFQADIIGSIILGLTDRYREIGIKGCTGAGKGAAVAMAANLWFEASPESKILINSQSQKHAKNVMLAEVITWRKTMRCRCRDEILETKVKAGTKKFIELTNPDKGEGFTGHHGGAILFIFDECCFSADTEVLTDSGWKHFWEIGCNDKLLTMSPQSHDCRYVKPQSVHVSWRNGEMYEYKDKSSDFCVTPDHMMWHRGKSGWRANKISELSPGRQHPMPRTVRIENPGVEFFVIPGFEGDRKLYQPRTVDADDWLRFLAWYLSEGHIGYVNGTPYTIGITQKCPLVRQEIIGLLQRLGFRPKDHTSPTTPQVMVHERRIAEHLLSQCGTGAKEKTVPRWVFSLSVRQISLFLDVYVRGDGSSYKNRDIIYTASPGMANDLQELVLLEGSRSTLAVRQGGKSWIVDHWAECGDSFSVSRVKNQKPLWYSASKVRKINYEGWVWCPSVPPDHLVLTRRNGKVIWSGNTAAPPEYWELAKTQADMMVALGNPRSRAGWFNDLFPDVDPDTCQDMQTAGGGCRRLVTISGKACTNVKTGKDIVPNQLSRAEYNEIVANADENHVRVYAWGQFPREDAELQLILPSWLKKHKEAWKPGLPMECFGLDVADSEKGDKTVLACGGREGVSRLLYRQAKNVMSTVGWTIGVVNDRFGIDLCVGQHPISVDAVGVGSGVASRLDERGVWVIVNHGGAAPEDRRHYKNKRAETYARLAERLNPEGRYGSEPWPLPPDAELMEELAAPDKIYDSEGRFRLTPKTKLSGTKDIKDHRGQVVTTIKQKLGRSPDKADGVAYLWEAVYMLHFGGGEGAFVRDEEFVSSPPGEYADVTDEEIEEFDPFFREIIRDVDERISERDEWDY